MTAALLSAYRRSRYEAAGAMACIGRRSAGIDALLRSMGVRQGAFITAWNPMSRCMPMGWNQRMAARLAQQARRFPAASGRGGAGRWHEDHLLLGTDPRRVLVLARRFHQKAIVAVRQGAPARLLLLHVA